jgi:hypothetical protein
VALVRDYSIPFSNKIVADPAETHFSSLNTFLSSLALEVVYSLALPRPSATFLS